MKTVYTVGEIDIGPIVIVVDDILHLVVIIINGGVGTLKFHLVHVIQLCIDIFSGILAVEDVVVHGFAPFFIVGDLTDDHSVA